MTKVKSLTTLGSPPWVATCSRGAGAAALGKKMLIRFPIFLSSNALCNRLGFNRFALFVYILYSVRFVSLIRKNDTGVKIARRLSHRLVGVPPLKLYRTANPLILFCGQTSREDGVSYVKRTQKYKMTNLLKLVLRKIQKYRNLEKPFNSFCGQYLRVDGK